MKKYNNVDEFLDDYMNNPIADEPGMCKHLKRAFEAGQESNCAVPKIAEAKGELLNAEEMLNLAIKSIDAKTTLIKEQHKTIQQLNAKIRRLLNT